MRLAVALLLCACATAPVRTEPNPHAPGRTLHLQQTDFAPFDGWLIADSEHARREWSNERVAGELASLETHDGGKILSLPVLLGVVAGTFAAAFGLGVAVMLPAATRR